MILVDKRCDCGNTVIDVFADDKYTCGECGGEMKRIFGSYNKYKEFIPGFYHHFEAEPIWLNSADEYTKACKKYNVAQKGGAGLWQREKH